MAAEINSFQDITKADTFKIGYYNELVGATTGTTEDNIPQWDSTDRKLKDGIPITDLRPPIGSVIAWLKSFTNTPSLPDGWVECNGQTLSDGDSVYNGQTIPDLNGSSGTERFLRGQTTSGGTGGSETHSHSIGDTGTGDQNSGQTQPALSTNNTSTLPSYYEVVWIMKVR